MNLEELRNTIKQLDHDQVLSLLNMVEHEHPIKVTAITRRDIEIALSTDETWSMTDHQWDNFQQTYFWRKGIEENVDYGFLWSWVLDEWSDLGYDFPQDEVTA